MRDYGRGLIFPETLHGLPFDDPAEREPCPYPEEETMSHFHRHAPELANTPADPWWTPPAEPPSSEAAGPESTVMACRVCGWEGDFGDPEADPICSPCSKAKLQADLEVLADALTPSAEPTEMERYLRHALVLIQAEAEAFPDEDGLQAGRMARNALAEADRLAARLRDKQKTGGDS